MRLIFTSLLILMSIFTFAQNGGQSAENQVLKLSYLGVINGQQHFALKNKLSCDITTDVSYTSYTGTESISANGTAVIITPLSVSKMKAKLNQGCSTDKGWVEASTGVILPVKFLYVNAQCVNNGVVVSWGVAEEVNVKVYQVQASFDAQNWTTVREFAPGSPSYSYQHVSGAKFYRVAEVDNDNQMLYSKVISVAVEKRLGVTVFPNPLTQSSVISLSTEHPSVVTITLYSASGVVLNKFQTTTSTGLGVYKIGSSHLPPGSYVLVVETDTEARSIKLSK